MNKYPIGLFLGLLLVVSCQKENAVKQVDDVCSIMDDIVFMKYCYDHFDVNHDGKVSMEEANAVSKMDFFSSTIRSLKGIEYFPNLTYLDCRCGELTTIDVSKNTSLTYLDCRYNNLNSIDISKNTSLTYLNCSQNQLSSLDVSKNTSLTDLNCSQNQLSSLDVSKNTSLTYLNCQYNRLNSIDVSNNAHLRPFYYNPQGDLLSDFNNQWNITGNSEGK